MSIMAVPVPAADELGHPGGHATAWHHSLGPGYVARGYEENPDLEFPRSIAVYDRMRKTDGQISAFLRAITQALLGVDVKLVTKGVRPAVVSLVETELGLHRQQTRAGRTARQGVVFHDHLRDVMLAIPLGFMPFEPVWEVGPPTREQEGMGLPDTIAHLIHLGPRLPRTVQEIRVERNGDLAGILQAGVGWDTSGQGAGVQIIGGPGNDDTVERWIPARNLLFYCFEREGADWAGSSLLRSAYKNWLIKDGLIRTDALSGERNGMGLPIVYFTEEGDRETALGIATGIRSGAHAGVAIADGKYRVELLGVQGTIKALLPSIEYHDRAAAQAALAMFLNLGHDGGLGNGSAIGDTFLDLFVDSLGHVGDWIGETVTEGLIRELVTLNFGPDEPYPVLELEKPAAEATATAEALATLADAGIITADAGIEADVRRRYKLPVLPEQVVESVPGEDLSPAALDPVATAPGSDPVMDRAEALVARLAELRAAR